MRRALLLLPGSLALASASLSADLKPDANTDIPESAKRPVVVKLEDSQVSALKSQLPKALLPEGMELTVAAAAPLVTHPIMGCLDDRGRLFLGDGTGVNWNKAQLEKNPPNRVLMLEDTDKDGTFDKSTIFADKMTFPQGACWLDGSLYVCSPPGLWKLTDTDHDGIADKREMIVGGFDYTGNAADVHGPFLHPNGRLYWCHGRKGHKVLQKDGTPVHEGLASGIWSCKPDGSDIQWHSLGCGDNPVEVDFTPEGEIIGVQNLYYNQPRGDVIVHWLYGGVYERADQMKAIEGLPRTLEHMPVMYNFGHVAVSGCGFWRNSPTANREPRTLNFMVTHFNTQRVVRMELTPDGATYKATEHEFLRLPESPDVHFTDVMEDADGSLLVVDTGGWFRIGCPSSLMAKPDIAGAVYRVKRKGAPTRAELAKQGKPDPWGGDVKWSTLTDLDLADHLATGNPFRVQLAVNELIKRGADGILGLQGLLPSMSPAGKVNAVWLYSRLAGPHSLPVLRSALNDRDPSVRRAGCNAFAGRLDQSDLAALARLARDDDPQVRLAALRPLAWVGIEALAYSDALHILDLARPGVSPPEEHALIVAFSSPRRSSAALASPRLPLMAATDGIRCLTCVQLQLAERQPGLPARCLVVDELNGVLQPEQVLASLADDDANQRAVAAGIVQRHPDWAPVLTAGVARWLEEADMSPARVFAIEEVTRTFLGVASPHSLLATMLKHESAELRASALRILATQTSGITHEAWLPPLQNALGEARPGDIPLLLDAVKKLKTDRFNAKLQAIADDAKQPLPLRLKALDAMKGGKLTPATLALLQDVLTGSTGSAAARIQAAGMLASAPLDAAQTTALAPALATVGPVELKELMPLIRKNKDAALLRTLSTELAKNPALGSMQESLYRTSFADKPTELFENIVLPALRKANKATEAKTRRLPALAQKVAADGCEEDGRRHFEAGKGTCIACHKIGAAGRPIGPDLSKIGAIRTERDLLESILFPSNTLARDYEAHVIETSDGQSIMGVIKSHTAEGLLVMDVAGQEKTLPHGNIVADTTLTTSLMPLGLDGTLSEQELCDMVAWLRSLR